MTDEHQTLEECAQFWFYHYYAPHASTLQYPPLYNEFFEESILPRIQQYVQQLPLFGEEHLQAYHAKEFFKIVDAYKVTEEMAQVFCEGLQLFVQGNTLTTLMYYHVFQAIDQKIQVQLNLPFP